MWTEEARAAALEARKLHGQAQNSGAEADHHAAAAAHWALKHKASELALKATLTGQGAESDELNEMARKAGARAYAHSKKVSTAFYQAHAARNR